MVFILQILYICFNYSRNIFRDFQAACANIGAEMAFVDTNAEFEEIRQGVCNNETTNQMEIYVHLEKHDSGNSKKFADELTSHFILNCLPNMHMIVVMTIINLNQQQPLKIARSFRKGPIYIDYISI